MMTQPPTPTDDAYQRLLAENIALKEALRRTPSGVPAEGVHRPRRWRTALSIVFITVGALLAPAALVSAWAATELSDTDRFVETLAPIARDPDVQEYLTEQIVTIVDDQVDITALTQEVFQGIADLGLPPRAASTLTTLAPAAAQGLRGLLTDVVQRLVESDAFADLWDQALRTSHTQVVGLLTDEEDRILTIDPSGVVGIQVAPLLERVKARLQQSGFPFADQIPVVDATIQLTTVENIGEIRAAYNLTLLLGRVLPWVSIGLLALGVIIANNKPRALAGAGFALGVAMLFTMFLGAVGETLFVSAVSPSVIPSDVALPVYDAVLTFVYSAALAVAILGFITGIAGLLMGSSRGARSMRHAADRGFTAVRRLLYERGPLGEGFGLSVYRARIWIRAVIILGGVLVLVLSRPLTPSMVVGTAAVVLVLLAIVTALERPPAVHTASTTQIADAAEVATPR